MIDKDTLSAEASNIAALLWGVEGQIEDLPLVGECEGVKRLWWAGLAGVSAARQLLNKLADDIDALPKG